MFACKLGKARSLWIDEIQGWRRHLHNMEEKEKFRRRFNRAIQSFLSLVLEAKVVTKTRNEGERSSKI